MGVVYKLTKEVIQFILNQKKNNPNLGCRALAKMANERFKLEVSKSSVNAIIKEAGLSKSVGRRRTISPQPKTPPETMVKPFEPAPIISKKATPLLPKETPLKIIDTKKDSVPEIKPILPALPEKPAPFPLPKITPFSDEKLKAISEKKPLPEDFLEAPKQKIEEFPVNIEDCTITDNDIIDSLGSFFLKAMQFRFSDKPLLLEMLQEHIPQGFEQGLGLAADSLLYLTLFGKKEPRDLSIQEQNCLWVLSNLKKAPLDVLGTYLRQIESIKGLPLTIHSKCSQFFRRVNYIKITLEDNTVLFIDGQFKSVWQQPVMFGHLSTTYYSAVRYISETFVDNVQSVKLLTLPTERSFSKIALEFIYACQNLADKKIVKISAYDENNSEIKHFLDIPLAKRYFIFGFWPWQKECLDLIAQQEDKEAQRLFSQDLNRDIYYYEGEIEFSQHIAQETIRLRYALLKDAPAAPVRMGLLTNIFLEEQLIEEIINMYLNRWPNLEEGYQDFMRKVKGRTFAEPEASSGAQETPAKSGYKLDPESVTYYDNISYIVEQLSANVQSEFFPPAYKDVDLSTMKQRFYSLSGTLRRADQRILVTLLVPKGYSFVRDLLYAVRRVNESDIRDHSKNKIVFTLARKK